MPRTTSRQTGFGEETTETERLVEGSPRSRDLTGISGFSFLSLLLSALLCGGAFFSLTKGKRGFPPYIQYENFQGRTLLAWSVSLTHL